MTERNSGHNKTHVTAYNSRLSNQSTMLALTSIVVRCELLRLGQINWRFVSVVSSNWGNDAMQGPRDTQTKMLSAGRQDCRILKRGALCNKVYTKTAGIIQFSTTDHSGC
jgi:hypothetical protein